jgi:hypothetical protein
MLTEIRRFGPADSAGVTSTLFENVLRIPESRERERACDRTAFPTRGCPAVASKRAGKDPARAFRNTTSTAYRPCRRGPRSSGSARARDLALGDEGEHRPEIVGDDHVAVDDHKDILNVKSLHLPRRVRKDSAGHPRSSRGCPGCCGVRLARPVRPGASLKGRGPRFLPTSGG